NNQATDQELAKIQNLENEINNLRDRLKFQNIDDVKEQKYDYLASVTYMDIIAECEKMGDFIINIVEALNEATNKKDKIPLLQL
ncbi:MAG TPA: hypothetical protein PK410_00925, partial [Paludibacteraceae bacterium]|nr:hypothetical protein [Paludibacteraceae bacterium]